MPKIHFVIYTTTTGKEKYLIAKEQEDIAREARRHDVVLSCCSLGSIGVSVGDFVDMVELAAMFLQAAGLTADFSELDDVRVWVADAVADVPADLRDLDELLEDDHAGERPSPTSPGLEMWLLRPKQVYFIFNEHPLDVDRTCWMEF